MSTTPARSALACGAVVVACLVVGGCLPILGSDEEDSAPRVGQCYHTPDSVLPDAHDPTPPVDCEQPHTLETYAVLRADGPLDRKTMARMDERCVEEVRGFLGGGDFRHTAVSVYYFAPTRAAQDDGARWVRCDVAVVTDTAVSGTRQVTGSLQDAFADGVPASYRRCLDGAPEPSANQPLVPCSRPHVAQQLPSGVDLGAADRPYPGIERLSARANPRCARAVRVAMPDSGRSLVVVPTARMWEQGVTTAQCWALAAPGDRLNDSEAQPA